MIDITREHAEALKRALDDAYFVEAIKIAKDDIKNDMVNADEPDGWRKLKAEYEAVDRVISRLRAISNAYIGKNGGLTRGTV